GDVNAATGTDLDVLDGIECLQGTLRVAASDITTVTLPDLEQITGSLLVEGNASLTGVTLAALTQVDGHVRATGNPGLTTFNLDAMTSVGLDLVLGGDPAEPGSGLPALVNINRLRSLDEVGGH